MRFYPTAIENTNEYCMEHYKTAAQTFTLITAVVLAKWVFTGFGITDTTSNRDLRIQMNYLSADMQRGTGTGTITLELQSSTDDVTYGAEALTMANSTAASFVGQVDGVTNFYAISSSGGAGAGNNVIYVRLIAKRSVADGTSTLQNIGFKACIILPTGITVEKTV